MPRLSESFVRAGTGEAPGRRVLVVLVCLSIVIFTLYSLEGASGPVHTLRKAVQVVASPFEWVGAQVSRPFQALSERLADATADTETLTSLEEQNAELVSQLSELNEYRLENERLRAIINLSSAYGAEGIGARVIGSSSNGWTSTVTIDKGSSSGVVEDMPVIDGNGVVGQVTEVSLVSSTVTLLADSSYTVSAILQNSRENGVLCGSVDGSLHLEYVPVSTSVSLGEYVVTSGMDGVYPKGLMLGVVTSVTSSPSDVYYDIVVAPVASVQNYEEVYVITSFDSSRSAVASETLLTTGSLYADSGDASSSEVAAAADGEAAGDGDVAAGEE